MAKITPRAGLPDRNFLAGLPVSTPMCSVDTPNGSTNAWDAPIGESFAGEVLEDYGELKRRKGSRSGTPRIKSDWPGGNRGGE